MTLRQNFDFMTAVVCVATQVVPIARSCDQSCDRWADKDTRGMSDLSLEGVSHLEVCPVLFPYRV